MECKPMSTRNYRPVADGRRGSKRDARKGKAWLGWLRNPLVLKAVIALARFGYELARIVLTQ